jgi:hypothetical protein
MSSAFSECAVSRGRRAEVILCLAFGSVFPITIWGCGFGPMVLEKTHARFNEAVRRVDEEQLLRNLVRIRYNETPLKLGVSSIAAQYELAGSAEARPFFLAPNPSGTTFKKFADILPDVSVSGSNRPTITLIPAGSNSIRRFLTPIAPETLVFLATTSWPVSPVFRLWVERLNGVPNAPSASGPQRDFAPNYRRFQRVAQLLQAAQDLELMTISSEEREADVGGPLPAALVNASAAVDAAKNGMEYRPQGDGSNWSLIRKDHRLVLELNPLAVSHPVIKELVSILNLEPGRMRYDIVVASNALDPRNYPRSPSKELVITPRSNTQVYYYLTNGIEVPPEHIAAGLVRPATLPDGTPFDGHDLTAGLFTVHAAKGHKPPPNALIAVKEHGYWYYIDDRDQETKVTFALVLQLSRLDFGLQEPTGGPFLTLPVGR